MRYEKFSDFVNNVGYFEEKVDCHSRKIYVYDEDKAKQDLIDLIKEYDMEDELMLGRYDFETIDDVIEEFLEDFDEDRGIGSKGYEKLSEHFSDVWEFVGDIGKENTGILDLYMLAFKLAMQHLNES